MEKEKLTLTAKLCFHVGIGGHEGERLEQLAGAPGGRAFTAQAVRMGESHPGFQAEPWIYKQRQLESKN